MSHSEQLMKMHFPTPNDESSSEQVMHQLQPKRRSLVGCGGSDFPSSNFLERFHGRSVMGCGQALARVRAARRALVRLRAAGRPYICPRSPRL